METTTIAFPIYIILQKKRGPDFRADLENFEARKAGKKWLSSASASMTTGSTNSKGSKAKTVSMELLEDHLNSGVDGLQIYASFSEFNGENIFFLRRVIGFKKQWASVFGRRGANATKARMTMFRVALDIYITLVDQSTAKFPINLESDIYKSLKEMFTSATNIVATRRNSTSSTPVSAVTPWEEPEEDPFDKRRTINGRSISLLDLSGDNDSSEAIVTPKDLTEPSDPLSGFIVPQDFGPHVLDAAYKSIRFMVWSGTWQNYMAFKRNSGLAE